MELLLNRLNGFGKFQKFILLIVSLISSLCGFVSFTSVFAAGQHQIICVNKNDDTLIQDSCKIWSNLNSSKNSSYSCELNEKYYGLTMINEWGFQCKNIYKASAITTAFMVGTMLSCFGGWLGDKLGRKTNCIISIVGLNQAAIISEILITKFDFEMETQYFIYLIGQFFIGFFSYSLFYGGMILLGEITSLQHQTLVSTINLYTLVLGEAFLALYYYFVRDWHDINIFIGFYSVIILLLILLVVQESPRYLIANKHYEECYNVLKKISRVNQRTDQMFTRERFFKQIESNNNGTIDGESDEINFHEIQSLLSIRTKPKNPLVENEENEIEIKDEHNSTVLFFLLNPIKNLVVTLLMGFVWISITLIYFGIALSITSISENYNPYVMFGLSCLAEAVGYTFCFLNEKFSKKIVMVSFLILSAIFLFLVIIVPQDEIGVISWRSYLIITFATCARTAVSTAVSSGYIYTFLMFPAGVRNTLFTLCLSIGKIGSLAAPSIVMLQVMVWKPMPYLIFSGSVMLAGCILAMLPDPSKLEQQTA